MSGEAVRDAVERDLKAFDERQAGVSGSALAVAALRLAERMDDPKTTPTAVSNCARTLGEIMDRIQAGLPAAEQRGKLEELRERRERRRAG